MSKPFITITEEQWQRFIKSNAGVRAEIEYNPSKEYAKGYIKGFKSGLLDLLSFAGTEQDKYIDGVEQLAYSLEQLSGTSYYYGERDLTNPET